jgi:hypothetical protein
MICPIQNPITIPTITHIFRENTFLFFSGVEVFFIACKELIKRIISEYFVLS